MKILHISTNDTGGAASAAVRIHQSLLKNNCDSHILFLNRSTYFGLNGYIFDGNRINLPEEKLVPALNLKNYFLEKVFKKFSNHNNNVIHKEFKKKSISDKVLKDTLVKFEIFSKPYSTFDLKTSSLFETADIIHLHWTAGFIDFPSFFENLNKPIVISMYDEYYYLGGFHYENDYLKNWNEYGKLESEYKKIKFECYRKANNLNVITGSDWIKEKIVKSDIKFNNIKKIYYPLDTKLYRQIDKNSCRDILQISQTKKVFLFASENIKNYRKGFDILMEAIKSDLFDDVVFLILGNLNFITLKPNFISLGKVRDELFMPVIYSAADFFVLPSREENFSYTMIESLCCGTPTIAFDIGDHKIFLEENKFGLISDRVDSTSLQNTLLLALNEEVFFDNHLISENARKMFSDFSLGEMMFDFYKEILE